VNVEGVNSNLAGPGGAVSSTVARIALASHGLIGVPEGIDVAEVIGGELSDGLTCAMA
jgi:hypothetical protein